MEAQKSDSVYHAKVDSILLVLQESVFPFIESLKSDQFKKEQELKAACEKQQNSIKKELVDTENELKQSRDSLRFVRNQLSSQKNTADSLKQSLQKRLSNFESFSLSLDRQDHHIQPSILELLEKEGKDLKNSGINIQQLDRLSDFKQKCEALRFADDLINKNLSSIEQIKEAKNKLNEAFSKGSSFTALSQENKKFTQLLSNYESRICELKDVINIILDLSVMPLEEKQENLLKVISILDFKEYGYLTSLIQKFYLNPNISVLPDYKIKCS